MIKNGIIISDTHSGCGLALMPKKVRLDDGNIVYPSRIQKKLNYMWEYFWNEWVPEVTKEEPYVLIHNGDAIDGVHHNSKTQLTQNLTIQKDIALELLAPRVESKLCQAYYHIRGTEAHVGKSAEDEEDLARQLGAKRNEDGQYARYDLWLAFGKKNNMLAHFSHHIGTTNSAAYESTAVYKEMVEAYNEAGRWGDRAPDVVVRSHRDRQFETRIATKHGYGISLVTPAWQVKTPFVWKQGLGRSSTPQIGGYLIRSGDEDTIFTRFWVHRIERSKTEFV